MITVDTTAPFDCFSLLKPYLLHLQILTYTAILEKTEYYFKPFHANPTKWPNTLK